MIRKIVSFAIHQPLFMILLLVLFIGAGIAAFHALPIEAFPDVTDVQVPVITLFPGHAPEEVEKQVTIPLEIALAGVPHSVRMFSHTQFGLSFLTLTFDDQIDDYFARQRVLERLQQADLPQGIQPQLAPLSTPIGEIYPQSKTRATSQDGWRPRWQRFAGSRADPARPPRMRRGAAWAARRCSAWLRAGRAR